MTIEKDTEKEFINLINKHKKTKSGKSYRISFAAASIICIFLFIYFGTSLFSSQKPTSPWGKIITPAPGSTTSKNVAVLLETKNIGTGQYLWLVVDKPHLELCWPKASKIQPNHKLQVNIHESGPKEPYTLSLYLVNKTIDDQWQYWFDHEIFGGLPMLPKRKRLDSVVLMLGN